MSVYRMLRTTSILARNSTPLFRTQTARRTFQSKTATRINLNERRWQYAAIFALTTTTVLLTSSQIYSDSEPKKRDSEQISDDPYNHTHHPDEPSSIPHPPPTEGLRLVSAVELGNHDTEAAGYWVAINGVVYDVTEFVTSGAHPGGSKVLIQNTGKDASSVYGPLHPPGKLHEQ
jgi:cytochrome b involved in lipid metabolism